MNVGTAWAKRRALKGVFAASAAAALLVAGFGAPAYAASTASGALPDTAFNTRLGSAANNMVIRTSQLDDGTLLAGGRFTSFNGQAANNVVALNADGTTNNAFNRNLGTAANNEVVDIIQLRDGTILLGGSFTTFNGQPASSVVALNADGTLNTAFNTNLGTGFDGYSLGLAQLEDGTILIGGAFHTLNGQPAEGLAALDPDGTPNATFKTNIGTAANSAVYGIAQSKDGKVLLGGSFTTFNGQPANHLAALSANGTLDSAFNANIGGGTDATVRNISVLADGSPDVGVNTNLGSAANALAGRATQLQDGTVLIGGAFTQFNGAPANHLVAVNPDGTRNVAFNANLGNGASGDVYSITQLRNGTGVVLFAGRFSSLGGQPANNLIAFSPVDAAIAPIPNQSTPVHAPVNLAVSATASDAGSFTYTATGLPEGLRIDSATGVVSGTPITPNATRAPAQVTVTAVTRTLSVDTSFAWTVTPVGLPPTIEGTAPAGKVGKPYTFTPIVKATKPAEFAIASGHLPAGFSLNTKTGEVSGVAKAAGTSTFQIAVTDSGGSAAREFTIQITADNSPGGEGGGSNGTGDQSAASGDPLARTGTTGLFKPLVIAGGVALLAASAAAFLLLVSRRRRLRWRSRRGGSCRCTCPAAYPSEG